MKPSLMTKAVFNDRMLKAYGRVSIAHGIIAGGNPKYHGYTAALFRNKKELEEFKETINRLDLTNYDVLHMRSFQDDPKCYQIYDQKIVIFPPDIKLFVNYIQFKEGVVNPCVIPLGAI